MRCSEVAHPPTKIINEANVNAALDVKLFIFTLLSG
jgi:hypothetical protein